LRIRDLTLRFMIYEAPVWQNQEHRHQSGDCGLEIPEALQKRSDLGSVYDQYARKGKICENHTGHGAFSNPSVTGTPAPKGFGVRFARGAPEGSASALHRGRPECVGPAKQTVLPVIRARRLSDSLHPLSCQIKPRPALTASWGRQINIDKFLVPARIPIL
jgi:hypothetical protein